MSVSRSKVRVALVAAALVLAVVGPPALAAVLARSTAGNNAATGSWGAAAGPVGGPPVLGDYVVRFPGGATQSAQYLELFNTGTLPLTAQTYRAVNAKPTTGNAPPTVSLDACVGGRFDTLTGLCIGGNQVNLTNSDAPPTTVALALGVGQVVHVRAAANRLANFPNPYQTTITITVARSQAAAGRTRTS